MRVKKVVVLLILLFVISACDSKTEKKSDNNSSGVTEKSVIADNKKISKEESKEITFTLETIDGTTIHIKEIENGLEFQEFKGQPIYLILFGYRCPPCLKEIPELIELTKEHQDLKIIAMEVQGLDSDALQEFVTDRGINYPVISGYNYMDFISYIQLKAQWGGAIPLLLGLNKKGEVEIMQIGGVSKRELEIGYKELIN